MRSKTESRSAAAVRMHFTDGMRVKDIAAALECSQGAVSIALLRHRRRNGFEPPRRGRPLKEPAALASPASWWSETPRERTSRVDREVAEGKRCAHPMRSGKPCSLLLPCAAPELAMGLAP